MTTPSGQISLDDIWQEPNPGWGSAESFGDITYDSWEQGPLGSNINIYSGWGNDGSGGSVPVGANVIYNVGGALQRGGGHRGGGARGAGGGRGGGLLGRGAGGGAAGAGGGVTPARRRPRANGGRPLRRRPRRRRRLPGRMAGGGRPPARRRGALALRPRPAARGARRGRGLRPGLP